MSSVTAEYLEKDTVSFLQKEFSKEKMLRLESFIDSPPLFKRLRIEESRIPNKYSFSESHIKLEIDGLEEFFKLLIGKGYSGMDYTLLRFSPGDYTLLHDQLVEESRYVGFLFLTDDWKKEFGGNLVGRKRDDHYVFTPRLFSLVLFKTSEVDYFIEYLNDRSSGKFLDIVKINF